MDRMTSLDLVGQRTQYIQISLKLILLNGGILSLVFSKPYLILMVYGSMRVNLSTFVMVHAIKISTKRIRLETNWHTHQPVPTSKLLRFPSEHNKAMGHTSNLIPTHSMVLNRPKQPFNTSNRHRRELSSLRSHHSQDWANMDQDGWEIASLAMEIWNCLSQVLCSKIS